MSDQSALFKIDEKQEWIVPAKFAKEIEVSPEAVRKAIETGRFDHNALRKEKTKTGKPKYKINLRLGKDQWEENRGRDTSLNVPEKGRNDAKYREQVANANLAELKFKEKDGQLIRADAVKMHFSRIGATVRDSFLNLPTKLAPQLVSMDDPKEIENLLKKYLTETLKELSDAGTSGKLYK